MANEFKYIINTELKFDTGSLNNLLAQAKQTDQEIRRFFESNEAIELKLGLDEHYLVGRLRQQVNSTITTLNNSNQLEHIKVGLQLDETSINRLHSQLASVREQIETIARTQHAKPSFNVKTQLEKGELEKIQRLVGNAKATIKVGLKLDNNDVQKVERMVNSIKGTATAHVRDGMRQVGSRGRITARPETVGRQPRTPRNPNLPAFDVTPSRLGGDNISPTNLSRWTRNGAGSIISRYHTIKQAQETVAIHNHLQQLANKQVENIGNQLARVGKENDRQRDLELRKQQVLTQKQYQDMQKELDMVTKKIAKGQQKVKVDGKFVPIQQRRRQLALSMNAHNQAVKMLNQRDNEMFNSLARGSKEDARYYEHMQKMMEREYVDPYRQAVAQAQINKISHQQRQREQANARNVIGRQVQQRQKSGYDKSWDKLLTSRSRDDQRYYEHMSQMPQSSYHTSDPSREAMAYAEINRRASEQKRIEESNTRRVLERQANARVSQQKTQAEQSYWDKLSNSRKKDDRGYYDYLRNNQSSGFHNPIDPVRSAMAQAEIARRQHEQRQIEQANQRRVLEQQANKRVEKEKTQQEQAYWDKLSNSRNKDDRGYYSYLHGHQNGYKYVDPVRSAMAQAQITRIENEQRQREEENARKVVERQAGRRVGTRLANEQAQREREAQRTRSLANQPSYMQQLEDKHIKLVQRGSLYQGKLENLTAQLNSADFNRNADEKAKRIALKQLNKYRGIVEQVNKDKERILSILQAEINKLNTRSLDAGLSRLPAIHTIQDEMAHIHRGIRNAQEKAMQQSVAEAQKYQDAWDKMGNKGRNTDDFRYYQAMQQMSQRPIHSTDPHRQTMAQALINSIDYANQQGLDTQQRQGLLNQAGMRLQGQSSPIGGSGSPLEVLRNRELALQDPNLSLREKGRIVKEELVPQYAELARQLGIEIPKSFQIFHRDANGIVKPIRTMTYEFDRWGQVTQKSHKSFSDMLQSIGGNLFIYGAITAGFFAITASVKASIATIAEFESQMLRVDNMSKNFSDFGRDGQGGYQATSSTMAKYDHKTVESDTFDIATQYGFDINKTVMPLYQRIMKRQDLSDGPSQTKAIEKQILNFALASYGPSVDEQQIDKVASDYLATFTNNFDKNKSKKQNISKMGQMIDYFARLEQMTGYSEKAIDVVGELSVDARNKGINPKYIGAMAGGYTLVQEDDEPAMISRTIKTMTNSLTSDSDHTKRVFDILNIDPYKPLVKDKNGKLISGGKKSGEELLREYATKLQTMDLDDNTLNTISKELATSDAHGGSSKEMTPRIANLNRAMMKDEFQQMTNPMGEIWNTQGDAGNMAERNMKTLSSELRQALQNLKKFAVLLGDLGALDGLKAMIHGFNAVAEAINKVLDGISKMDAGLQEMGLPKLGSGIVQTATAIGMFKGGQVLFNKFAPQNIQGPVRQWWGGVTTAPRPNRVPSHFNVVGGRNGASAVVSDVATNTILGSVLNRDESRSRGINNIPRDSEGRRVLRVRPRAMNTIVDEMGNIMQQSAIPQRRSLRVNRTQLNNISQRTGRNTVGSAMTGAVANGIGIVVGELAGFLIGGLRNRSVAGAGARAGTTAVVSRVLATIGRFGAGLLRFVPILARLSVVGAILATVVWGAVEAFKYFNKKAAEESRKNSMKYGNAISTDEGRDRIKENLETFQKLGNLNPMTLSKKQRAQLEKVQKELEKDGIKTKVRSMGTPTKAGYVGAKDASYTYFEGTIDKDGNQITKEKTVSATKKNIVETTKTINNMGKVIDAFGKDGWAKAIEGVDGYNDRIREANKQIEDMSRLMTKMNINSAKNKLQFMGAENAPTFLAGEIKNIQDYMRDTDSMMKSIQNTKSFLEQGNARVQDSLKEKKDVINSVLTQKDMKKEEKKSTVKWGDLESRFNESYEAGTLDDLKQELSGKGDLNKYKLDYVRSLEEARKLDEKTKEMTDHEAQLTQQFIEQQQALKQLRVEFAIASTGLHVYEAQLQKIGSMVGVAQSVLNMSGTDQEKLRAGINLMKEQTKQLAIQKEMLANNQQAMARIKSSNSGQDFSTQGLYNPGPDGLSEAQATYKQLLESSYGMMDNVNATTEAMYQQREAIKELVLNSDKYADTWDRVQNRISLVKELNKEVSDIKVDAGLIDHFSQLRGAVVGGNQTQWRQSQLEGIRDRGLDVYMKAVTAMQTYGTDQAKLEEAFAEISKTTGDEFDEAFIQPLRDIVQNDLVGAGNLIMNGATKLDSVFNSFIGSLNSSAMNFQNILATGAGADQLPNYTPIQNDAGSGKDPKTMTYEELMENYIQQNFGYSKGSKGYMTMKKQMETSMTRNELISEMQRGVVTTASNSAVKTYNTNLDSHLGGKLAGYGQTFVKAGQANGIDPNLLAAIAMHETGNGTSPAIRNKNNVGGIMGSNGLRTFGSIEESINYMADMLRRLYFNQGLDTIPEIQKKYAPVGASNDPTGLNNNWISGVSSFYSQLTGSSVVSGGGGSSSSGGGGSRSTLKLGSRGEDVKALQKALGITADGIFGQQTLSAVKNYQKSKGLSVDGIVGSQTWGALGIGGGGSSTSSKSSGGGGTFSQMNSWFESVRGDKSKLTYSWGGAHVIEDWTEFLKKGIADCSGLVEQVYRKFAGIDLGTTNSATLYSQNDGGTKVTNKSQLQPGDLVFFGSSASKIHHVGIYAGNDEMWTINHQGTPVSKDKISSWGDYYGGKHYANAFTGGAGSTVEQHKETFSELLAKAVDGLYQGLEAQIALTNVDTMKKDYTYSANLDYGLGNVREPLGTSGRIAVFDRINATREDLYTKQYDNARQLEELNTTRKSYVDLANTALASGNTEQYNAYKDVIADLDEFGKKLRENSEAMAEWAKYLDGQINNDPRISLDKSTNYIRGGYDKLRSMQSQIGSPEYMRVVEEMNTMNGEYMTKQRMADEVGQVWNVSGVGTRGYNFLKRDASQEDINVLFQKMTEINGVLKEFAQGTQDWFVTLEDAVAVQQQLQQLEQQRLENAQSMFELTGQGLQGYIQQKAYTQSKDYTQANTNLSSAIEQYKNGRMEKGYGLITGGFKSEEDAQKVVDILKSDYNIGAKVSTDDLGGGATQIRIHTDETMTKDRANEVIDRLKLRDLGYGPRLTGGGSSEMDAQQQLATLQIIAGLQDQLTQQMNDYRSAVVGAFRAGAMSLEDYMDKMNDLRDIQVEAKENAIKMVDSISQTFEQSLTQALAGGMMGNMDSTQGFMDSIKQGLAGTISSQISGALLNNSGLQDVMNNLIMSITTASTSGNAEDIANMFNDNNFSDQLNDAMAPFLPLIEQIVASTQGMFAIMKNQTFNAPNGFKVDSYLYEMAKGKDFEGIKNWTGEGKNEAGSPTSGVGANSGNVDVPPPSSTPSGVPEGTSGSGATDTGAPSTTVPGGTGAQTPTQGTTPPPADTTPVNNPAPAPAPAPAPSTGGSHNHGTLREGARGDAVKEIQKAVGATQDGIWGPQTTSAVKAFQKKYGLSVDGIVGTNTWAKIHSVNGVGGGSSSGGSSSGGNTKTVKSAVNFRSSAGYGNNVISVLPKGAKVTYYGNVSGWAKVGYGGKTGYVGPDYIYHSGGIAGMMNFASSKALKANEIQAIMQKGEVALQPKQLAHLLGGALPKGETGSVNFSFNVTVNVEGGGYDQKGIEATVETAVQRAVQEVRRDQRFSNLTWRGTSY